MQVKIISTHVIQVVFIQNHSNQLEHHTIQKLCTLFHKDHQILMHDIYYPRTFSSISRGSFATHNVQWSCMLFWHTYQSSVNGIWHLVKVVTAPYSMHDLQNLNHV